MCPDPVLSAQVAVYCCFEALKAFLVGSRLEDGRREIVPEGGYTRSKWSIRVQLFAT